MSDPVIMAIVVGAVVVIALSLLGRVFGGRREAKRSARRAAELRKQGRFLEVQQAELERLAGRIIATSSTASIAGFEVVRQIEAVFTDGHTTPNKAVEHLKASAAEKGANAVVNLHSARPPSGKCVAQGDAVIVRPLEVRRPVSSPPPLPPLPPMNLDSKSSPPPRKPVSGDS